MAEIVVSLLGIQDSIAGVLRRDMGAVNVYNNPNQQNTHYPAWFINFISPSGIDQPTTGRMMRKLKFDIFYKLDKNITDLYDQYISMADRMDEKLELIPYPSIEQPETLIRVNKDRKWTIALDALHYLCNINVLVTRSEEDVVKMMVIQELNETVTLYEDWRVR